jgi:hypothetical protein
MTLIWAYLDLNLNSIKFYYHLRFKHTSLLGLLIHHFLTHTYTPTEREKGWERQSWQAAHTWAKYVTPIFFNCKQNDLEILDPSMIDKIVNGKRKSIHCKSLQREDFPRKIQTKHILSVRYHSINTWYVYRRPSLFADF